MDSPEGKLRGVLRIRDSLFDGVYNGEGKGIGEAFFNGRTDITGRGWDGRALQRRNWELGIRIGIGIGIGKGN